MFSPEGLKASIKELIITFDTAGLEESLNRKSWIKQSTYRTGTFYSREHICNFPKHTLLKASLPDRHYCLLFFSRPLDYPATPPFTLSLRYSLPLIGSLHTLSNFLFIRHWIYHIAAWIWSFLAQRPRFGCVWFWEILKCTSNTSVVVLHSCAWDCKTIRDVLIKEDNVAGKGGASKSIIIAL